MERDRYCGDGVKAQGKEGRRQSPEPGASIRGNHDGGYSDQKLLGRWLWVLFWLLVGSTAAEAAVLILEPLYPQTLALEALDAVRGPFFSTLSGLVLLRLSKIRAHYCWAGICALISVLAGAASALGWGSEGSSLELLLEIAVIAASLIGAYNEFAGHGALLENRQPELADRWRSLWRWYLWSIGSLMIVLLLSLLVPILALVIPLAVVVVMILLHLMRLVCLFRTAKCFRVSAKSGGKGNC